MEVNFLPAAFNNFLFFSSLTSSSFFSSGFLLVEVWFWKLFLFCIWLQNNRAFLWTRAWIITTCSVAVTLWEAGCILSTSIICLPSCKAMPNIILEPGVDWRGDHIRIYRGFGFPFLFPTTTVAVALMLTQQKGSRGTWGKKLVFLVWTNCGWKLKAFFFFPWRSFVHYSIWNTTSTTTSKYELSRKFFLLMILKASRVFFLVWATICTSATFLHVTFVKVSKQ